MLIFLLHKMRRLSLFVYIVHVYPSTHLHSHPNQLFFNWTWVRAIFFTCSHLLTARLTNIKYFFFKWTRTLINRKPNTFITYVHIKWYTTGSLQIKKIFRFSLLIFFVCGAKKKKEATFSEHERRKQVAIYSTHTRQRIQMIVILDTIRNSE